MSPRHVRRKGAVDTVATGFRWLFDHPVLIGVFVVVGVINAFLQLSPILSLVGNVISVFAAGIAHRYADRIVAEETPDIGEAAAEVARRMLSLIGILILYGIAVVLGTLALVLPGIYLALRLQLAFPACVLDDQSPLESLSTSWDLTSGISLKPFGLLVAAFISAVILSILLSLVASGIVLASGGEVPTDTGQSAGEVAEQLADQPRFMIAAALSQSIALALVVGAVQVAAARLYLSLRYGGHEPTPQ